MNAALKKHGSRRPAGAGFDNVSVRFPPGFKRRLDEVADAVGLTKNDIVKLAAMAAIEAIESRGNRITLPFKVEFGD